MTRIEVMTPGLATTVQGAPRTGHRHVGVAACGALDPWSQALANLLVGNKPDSAVLELTLTGPTLRFADAACIAVCGGGFAIDVDGVPVADARPVHVPALSVVRIGRAGTGARGYLAVRGGFAVDAVLGSLSTDLRGGFGGHHGRLLRAGDRLAVQGGLRGAVTSLHVASWWIDTASDDRPHDGFAVVRLLPGRDVTAPGDAVFAHAWTVAAASNRQGLRLSGTPMSLADPGERVSEPVAPGTVQLPPDGQPIVLLADAQTHGGYPRIGHAIRADWPVLAQQRPGDRVRFVPCARADAYAASMRQQQRFQRMALAVRSKGELDG